MFFFFNETATTEFDTDVHTHSRHDALPIYLEESREQADEVARQHEIQNLPATVGQRLEADGPAVLHDVGVVVGFAVAHELRAGGDALHPLLHGFDASADRKSVV